MSVAVRDHKEAGKKFRELISAGMVVLEPTHGKSQLAKRNISWPQVLAVLQRNKIVEGPYQTTSLKWRANFYGISAGDRITVVAELQESSDEVCLIITGFTEK